MVVLSRQLFARFVAIRSEIDVDEVVGIVKVVRAMQLENVCARNEFRAS